jgi:galactokinase
MEVFVPGRLCVLGEHTDWAGNYRDVNKHVPYGAFIRLGYSHIIHLTQL